MEMGKTDVGASVPRDGRRDGRRSRYRVRTWQDKVSKSGPCLLTSPSVWAGSCRWS